MNMIQDMIDFGFIIRRDVDLILDGFLLDEDLTCLVTIYGAASFGVLQTDLSETDGVGGIIIFSDTINPRDYGDDYRELNRGELESLKKLISVFKL